MTIWFATGNKNKKNELKNILSGAVLKTAEAAKGTDYKFNNSWEIKIPADAGINFDPEESGNTFLENALIKAGELYRLLEEHHYGARGDPVIADDSGICVDALNGRPGIHSARYCGPGLTASNKKLDAAERNSLLLAELGDNPRRSARFVCAMVLYYGPNRFYAAQETMEGELVKNAESARGKGGFGYDPILFIPEMRRTVAELTEDEKNQWSHRGKAGKIIAKILGGINT